MPRVGWLIPRHVINLILAIDLSKYHSVLCCYDPESKNANFRIIPTTHERFRGELLRQPHVTIAMEVCSKAVDVYR